jgi:four helix bundle protein
MPTLLTQFSHERLRVYQDVLEFIDIAEQAIASWDNRHAIVDQLSRASESIAKNLADGCRRTDLRTKQKSVDYSLRSALECAAYLDIACIKGLLPDTHSSEYKKLLHRIVGQLITLRKSWETMVMSEEETLYNSGSSGIDSVFPHEQLDVYQVSHEFMRWFCSRSLSTPLPGPRWKQID